MSKKGYKKMFFIKFNILKFLIFYIPQISFKPHTYLEK